MKPADKLRVDYSKREKDLMFHMPLGHGTNADGHWLSGVFSKELTEELERRGYDPKTLRFSVEPQAGNDKFATQREDKGDAT